MKNNNKKRCPICGSRKIYIRTKTNEIVCQDCGEVTKKEEIKK